MESQTKIKKYSVVYDLLSDLNEYKLKDIIEKKLKKMGYKVVVSHQKYKFKFDSGIKK